MGLSTLGSNLAKLPGQIGDAAVTSLPVLGSVGGALAGGAAGLAVGGPVGAWAGGSLGAGAGAGLGTFAQNAIRGNNLGQDVGSNTLTYGALDAVGGPILSAAGKATGAITQNISKTLAEKVPLLASKLPTSFSDALEIVRPKITPSLEQQAFNEGRVGKQGLITGAPIAPSASETKMAEAIQPMIDDGRITAAQAKSDPAAVKATINQEVHGINQGVKGLLNEPRFNVPFNGAQLDKYLQSAKSGNKVLFGGDATLEKAYDTVIDEFKTYVKTKNVAGLFDARQEFDNFIRNKYPAVFKPNKLGVINPADNVKQNALLDIRTAANEMVADLLDSSKIQSARKVFEPSTAKPLIADAKNFANKADFIRAAKEKMSSYKQAGFPSGTVRKTQSMANTPNQYATTADEDLSDLWDIAHTKIDSSAGDAYAAALRKETSLLRASENLSTKIRGITQKGKIQSFLDSPKGSLAKDLAKGALGGGAVIGGIGAFNAFNSN